MSLTAWIIQFALQSLFYKRILSWGGAQWLEGIKSALTLGWMTWDGMLNKSVFTFLLFRFFHLYGLLLDYLIHPYGFKPYLYIFNNEIDLIFFSPSRKVIYKSYE